MKQPLKSVVDYLQSVGCKESLVVKKNIDKRGFSMKLALLILSCFSFSFSQVQANKEKEEYRNYSETTPESVKNFYKINHTLQTLDFVLKKKKEYIPLKKGKMSIWDAIAMLDTLVDESDPDLDLPQSYHLFQTAEAIRKDGHPRWFILTGFIHDLGKILTAYGEPQWAVVGDTFPLGCAFSDLVVFPEFFSGNPDSKVPEYQTPEGIYSYGCGFRNLQFSWGHDEYLYHVVKDYLPEAGAYIIRYHSFNASHRDGAYTYLMDDYDKEMIEWVKLFCSYDLYSKNPERIDLQALRPYYEELVAEFFPSMLDW